jgi:hypothetical protein
MFDFIIVTLALVALGPIDMPINALRVLRAFRVLRLFGRMESLKRIFFALTEAIIPVLNSFIILFLVGSICASPRGPLACCAQSSKRINGIPSQFGLRSCEGGRHQQCGGTSLSACPFFSGSGRVRQCRWGG